MDENKFSRGGSGTGVDFRKATARGDNVDDENQNSFSRVRGWTIHDEFGNDPVLEARMGSGVSVDDTTDMGDVGTRCATVVDHEQEVCVASSSTSMHGSKV